MRKLIAAGCAVALSAQVGAAQAAASRSADATPQEIETLVQQGLAAANASDWQTAILRLTQAHLLAPDNPAPLYNLGLAHARADHPTAAMAWLEAYLAAAPQADNSRQVRAEIARLRQAAIETMRRYCETANAAVQQLRGEQRGSQRGSIRSMCEASTLVSAVENDSVLLQIAGTSYRTPAARLVYLERVSDSARRDNALVNAAQDLVLNSDFGTARRFALAVRDPARRSAVLAEVSQAERASQGDSLMLDRLRRGEYPHQLIATHLSHNRDYRWRALASNLALHGFYREARDLAASPVERGVVVAELAAAALRANDLDRAQTYAREILSSARIPRDQVLLAANAIRRAGARDAEAALRIIMAQVPDMYVKPHALATIEHIARQNGDAALQERARQLRESLPVAPARAGELDPNLDHVVLALAITGDYEAALALSAVIPPTSFVGWFDEVYATGGKVGDFLTGSGALEAGFAKVAFVAALRRQDRETRRALDLARDPGRRYWVYRNIAWGHTVARRFADAMRHLDSWPAPADTLTSARFYHSSRAQVLAAVAVRAARAGRGEDSERALSAMPPVGTLRGLHGLLAKFAAEAAMDVAEAYAAAGDSARAGQALATAFATIRAYRTKADVVLGANAYDEGVLAPTIARLRRSHSGALDRPGSQRPDVAAFARVALAMSGESPAALLQRLVRRDPTELPVAHATATYRLTHNMLAIEDARAEIADSSRGSSTRRP